MIRNNFMISPQTLLPKVTQNIMSRNHSKSELTGFSAYETIFGHQKPVVANCPMPESSKSPLEIQKIAFDRIAQKQFSKIPQTQSAKKFEIGDRVRASYKNGNRTIVFNGRIHQVRPNYVKIKSKNGIIKRWAYQFVRHRNDMNKIIDLGIKNND